MSISEISIRRPVFAWMLMFGLIIFGAISFQRMGISQMPDVNFPVINIGLEFENSAPEIMESKVVDILEDAMLGIEGLKNVTSTTSEGHANITCEFNLDYNTNVALEEVQNRITQVQNLLPSLLYPPVISKTNPDDQPILWVMLTADKNISLHQQMIYARNTLKDQFSSISGVGDVTFAGYVAPNLRVWADMNQLSFYQLTGTDLVNAIISEQIEQPAGRIEAPSREFNVRVLGEAKSTDDFSRIRINARGGGANYMPIPLNKVATIEEGMADIRAVSRFNGLNAVGLGIVKQHGSNAVEVSELIYKKIKQLQPTLPAGYHLDVQLDTTHFIRDSVNELNFTLILSAILTSIICYLFLGSWSSTINVLFAIPTSIVGTFIALYFLGFTLNTFTLLGLSLAIGIVVDDAIMMLENIVRHYEIGKSRRKAAMEGSKEITFAAIATTLAIAAIFVPVIFMKGIIGRFFYQYGITVTVAVLLSLLEALTLTPMRCARFLQSAKKGHSGIIIRFIDHQMERLSQVYHRSLLWALNHRGKILTFSVLFFTASIIFLSLLRKELIPQQDQSLFLLNVRTPIGSSISETDKRFKDIESYLNKQKEIKTFYTRIGNYSGVNTVNLGAIYVILKSPKERHLSQRAVMEKVRFDLRKLFPQDEVFVQDLSLTGFSASRGFPLEFTIHGHDWGKLGQLANQMTQKMIETGLIEDINTDYQFGMPELQIIPDRDKAAALGISMTTLNQEVGTLMGGQRFNANTEYPINGHRYEIRIRSKPEQHSSPKDLEKVWLRNNRGTEGDLMPLSQIAQVIHSVGPQVITRANRQRAIPIYANVAEGKSQQDALQVIENIGKEILPSGYQLEITGSAKEFKEVFNSLIFAMILGIAVAYMILASQFNSFIHPVTVLMALPFSLTGALTALYFTGQSLSLFSMIGLILLMGIVKKNSILLVDFTNQQRAQGLNVRQALLEACPVRLRPILMTSIATITGAIPSALNFGPGAETRIPMAISIIGGVTVSTLLTLYVVPCAYSMFSRFERPDPKEED